MKCLYKYPQRAFPYTQLVAENRQRDRHSPEFELIDTGVFAEDRYFDLFIEYAKASPEDILIQISIVNRGPETKSLHLLPTLWFRNTWFWNPTEEKSFLKIVQSDSAASVIEASHPTLEVRWLYCEEAPELLFTNNETNNERLFGIENASPYVKYSINNYIIQRRTEAVNPSRIGTKFAAHYLQSILPGETRVVRLRLCDTPTLTDPFGGEFDTILQKRISEADKFYQRINPSTLADDERNIQRQAFAGMLWSKQYYHYVLVDWLNGDSEQPSPPPERKHGRNHQWFHFFSEDILSMPDKREYPWFAAWDLVT